MTFAKGNVRMLLAALGLALAGHANASTVASTITVDGKSIFVTCSQTCFGLTGGSLTLGGRGPIKVTGGTQASSSSTVATAFDTGSSNEANQAQALDFLLDGTDNNQFTDGLKTNVNGRDTYSFASSAQYIAFKFGGGNGPNTFFLRLTGSGPITLDYDKNQTTGGGLSHITEFGQLAPIPVPAGGLLMLSGIGALIAFRRKKSLRLSA